MTPFPPKQQQRPRLPPRPEMGQAWLQVTQEGKASPGNSQSEALNLSPCREVGLPPQQFKAPTTDSASHIRPGWQKEEDLGMGVGAPKLPADKLHLPGVLLSPRERPSGSAGRRDLRVSGWSPSYVCGGWSLISARGAPGPQGTSREGLWRPCLSGHVRGGWPLIH